MPTNPPNSTQPVHVHIWGDYGAVWWCSDAFCICINSLLVSQPVSQSVSHSSSQQYAITIPKWQFRGNLHESKWLFDYWLHRITPLLMLPFAGDVAAATAAVAAYLRKCYGSLRMSWLDTCARRRFLSANNQKQQQTVGGVVLLVAFIAFAVILIALHEMVIILAIWPTVKPNINVAWICLTWQNSILFEALLLLQFCLQIVEDTKPHIQHLLIVIGLYNATWIILIIFVLKHHIWIIEFLWHLIIK